MSDKNLKAMRGQLRQIVKELLPELLTKELQTAIYKQLSGELIAKVQAIDLHIREQLSSMDNRAKDMQNFMMREMLNNTSVRPVEQPAPAVPQDELLDGKIHTAT